MDLKTAPAHGAITVRRRQARATHGPTGGTVVGTVAFGHTAFGARAQPLCILAGALGGAAGGFGLACLIDKDNPAVGATGSVLGALAGAAVVWVAFRLWDGCAERAERRLLASRALSPREQLQRLVVLATRQPLASAGMRRCVSQVRQLHRQWPTRLRGQDVADTLVDLGRKSLSTRGTLDALCRGLLLLLEDEAIDGRAFLDALLALATVLRPADAVARAPGRLVPTLLRALAEAPGLQPQARIGCVLELRRTEWLSAPSARRQLAAYVLHGLPWQDLSLWPARMDLQIDDRLVELLHDRLRDPTLGPTPPNDAQRTAVLRGLLTDRARPSAHLKLLQLLRAYVHVLPRDTLASLGADRLPRALVLLSRVPGAQLRRELDAAVELVQRLAGPTERARMTAGLLVGATTLDHWPSDTHREGLADPCTVARLIRDIADAPATDSADQITRLMQVCQEQTDYRLLRQAVDTLRELPQFEPVAGDDAESTRRQRRLARSIDHPLAWAMRRLPVIDPALAPPWEGQLRHRWLTADVEHALRARARGMGGPRIDTKHVPHS